MISLLSTNKSINLLIPMGDSNTLSCNSLLLFLRSKISSLTVGHLTWNSYSSRSERRRETLSSLLMNISVNCTPRSVSGGWSSPVLNEIRNQTQMLIKWLLNFAPNNSFSYVLQTHFVLHTYIKILAEHLQWKWLMEIKPIEYKASRMRMRVEHRQTRQAARMPPKAA